MSSAKSNQKDPNGDSYVDLSDKNAYLKGMDGDYLYHLDLGNKTHDLQKLFGDVKFVCMGGTKQRMKAFAEFVQKEFGYSKIVDYSSKRYDFYKIGPILSISHGMGMPSVSILLHELIKLVHYAKCKNPVFIRIGTCGGIGVTPGTVIVTKDAYNGLLKNVHEFVILGERVEREAKFDVNLANEFVACGKPDDGFDTILANTMATDDFYEGQGRVDGAVCFHSESQKLEFLKKLHSNGIRNMEMEATVFAALTKVAGIKSADICVSLVNRLNGDQVTTPKEEIIAMESRPQTIVARYIRKHLNN